MQFSQIFMECYIISLLDINFSVCLIPIAYYTYHRDLHQELIIAAWSISSDLDPDPCVVKYVK